MSPCLRGEYRPRPSKGPPTPSANGSGTMSSLPEAVLLTGSPVLPTAPLFLRAGPLTMLFEPETAFLRYVRLGERGILRGVYAAVRDRNWGTVAPRLSNLELEQREDS